MDYLNELTNKLSDIIFDPVEDVYLHVEELDTCDFVENKKSPIRPENNIVAMNLEEDTAGLLQLEYDRLSNTVRDVVEINAQLIKEKEADCVKFRELLAAGQLEISSLLGKITTVEGERESLAREVARLQMDALHYESKYNSQKLEYENTIERLKEEIDLKKDTILPDDSSMVHADLEARSVLLRGVLVNIGKVVGGMLNGAVADVSPPSRMGRIKAMLPRPTRLLQSSAISTAYTIKLIGLFSIIQRLEYISETEFDSIGLMINKNYKTMLESHSHQPLGSDHAKTTLSARAFFTELIHYLEDSPDNIENNTPIATPKIII